MTQRFMLFAAVLLASVFTRTAHAQQLITTCGEANGKAYYLEPANHGWVDDGVSGGMTSFLRYPDGTYDLLFRDKIGTRSARQDGATVAKVFGDDNKMLTIIVAYLATSVIETYQLTLDGNGRGRLIWSNIKNRSGTMGITRGMLLVSDCSTTRR
jgi:hypothetical protein